jgi:EmrB/QacA subfamily drug resistance transporter
VSAGLHVTCDRTIAAACTAAKARSDVHPRLILATTILASSLSFIDASVVNVGLPALARSLGASGAGLSWVINGYTLPLTALLLLGGVLGDVYGRRRLLLAGVSLFGFASLVCMAAPNLTVLLAGRVLQGAGAALLLPNSLSILGATFQREKRGRAIGIWAAAGAAGGAVGPVLGGALIDLAGWRTIFLLNVPLVLVALGLAFRFVPRDSASRGRSLDFAGAILGTVALTLLTAALTLASSAKAFGWAETALASGGIVLLTLFVFVERQRQQSALLPLKLFGSRAFTALNTLTLLLYGALGGLLVVIPFVLIEARGYSATAAGAALLPLPLAIALLSPTMGRLAGKTGSRIPLTLGPLIAAAGCLLAVRIGSGDGDYFGSALPALLVLSLGMSVAVAPLTTAVLATVESQHTGVASGFNSAVARLGGLIATALLSAVLAAEGAERLYSFRVACVVAALACVGAGLCAFLGVRERQRARG